jgi:uncharacterized membrane protein YhaH (DUF805 family)
MLRAIKHNMLNWRNFRGVSTRSEFWYFVLFLVLLNTVVTNILANTGNTDGNFNLTLTLNLVIDPAETWWTNIFTVVFGIPFLASVIRRCHDAGFKASTFAIFGVALLALNTVIAKTIGAVQVPTGLAIVGALLVTGWVIFVLTRPSAAPHATSEQEVFK